MVVVVVMIVVAVIEHRTLRYFIVVAFKLLVCATDIQTANVSAPISRKTRAIVDRVSLIAQI